MAELSDVLGTTVPDDFDLLSPTEQAELADLVERAAAQRAALIDQSIEDSLRQLPALLRRPVKLALGV